jgi:hypothetical protein
MEVGSKELGSNQEVRLLIFMQNDCYFLCSLMRLCFSFLSDGYPYAAHKRPGKTSKNPTRG